jgi:colanic acid biosynthesis glycosyl transferase WcaI
VGRDRVRIIENWADGSLVHPVTRAQNALRAAWRLADAFVVGYSGNLGRAHEFATLVGAIADVERSQSDDIRWLMIGGGALQEAFAAEIAKRGLRSVVVQPYQPRERLADSLSAADVHLVSLRPEMEGLIVPSKIYGILAAGRPAVFIGDPDGEVARLIRRLDCGVTVREGDPAALAEAVRRLAANPQLAVAMGARARAAFERAHDLEAAVRAWDALLGSLGAVAKS